MSLPPDYRPTIAQRTFVVFCACFTLTWFWFGMLEFFPTKFHFQDLQPFSLNTSSTDSSSAESPSGIYYGLSGAQQQIDSFRQKYIPERETPLLFDNVPPQNSDMQVRPRLSRNRNLSEVFQNQYKGNTASFYEDFYASASKSHCKDSDGGLNYALKGTITWSQEKGQQLHFTDRPIGEKELLEFYCEDGHLYAQSITCPVPLLGATCIHSSKEAQYEEFLHSAEKQYATTQIIRLNKNWNWISFSIRPFSSFVEDLFGPLYEVDEHFIVKDYEGNLYWPAMDINTLGELDFMKGYQVYVSQPLEMEIPGTEFVYPLHTSLQNGWNFFSYPHFEPTALECVLDPLIEANHLWAVKDFDNNTFTYVNGVWENEIGNFEPGQSYQIFLQNVPDGGFDFEIPEMWDCELSSLSD